MFSNSSSPNATSESRTTLIAATCSWRDDGEVRDSRHFDITLMKAETDLIKIGFMALLAALAVNSAVAAGAKIAGFEIGETIDDLDADVRTARNLAMPATVVLGQVPFTYYSCDSTKPADG